MYTTEGQQVRTFVVTVNRLAGRFVLKPLRFYTANVLCKMFTAASVVVTSEQERPCLEEVNQYTTFLSIFTGRSQWIKTCTVQTMWKQARTTYRISDVSAEETSQEMYRQKRTLYDLNLI